jgi:lipopolysaccharide/colanic/teichoic acid biosynthesis glycosyltransferase
MEACTQHRIAYDEASHRVIRPTPRHHWGTQHRSRAPSGAFPGWLRTGPFRRRAWTDRPPRNPGYGERIRRYINILIAGIGIVATAPIMLAVAFLIKLTSPGPVIYKQHRVGLDRRGNRGPGSDNYRRSVDRGGRLFTIYKFRTMRDDPKAGQQWASKNDPRVTRLGAFLRATRIDELPQFFNVLMGDMNIVGPRPEQPEIFRELRDEIHKYQDRQRVLPGITGLAQVTLGYDTSVDDVKKKVEKDLEYIERRSPAKDLMIMLKTVPVMVFRKVWK